MPVIPHVKGVFQHNLFIKHTDVLDDIEMLTGLRFNQQKKEMGPIFTCKVQESVPGAGDGYMLWLVANANPHLRVIFKDHLDRDKRNHFYNNRVKLRIFSHFPKDLFPNEEFFHTMFLNRMYQANRESCIYWQFKPAMMIHLGKNRNAEPTVSVDTHKLTLYEAHGLFPLCERINWINDIIKSYR